MSLLTTGRAPGVRYEHVDASPTFIQGVRSDVAGFVGVTGRGPVGEAVAVASWRQFETAFGGLHPHGLLGYAVKAFFDNGGDRCWVVRAAAPGVEVVTTGPAADPLRTPVVPPAGRLLVPGMVAAVTQTAAPVVTSATVAAVDPLARRVDWTAPLDPSLWLEAPVVVELPGVLLGATAGVQPADRRASVLRSVAGLRPGATVEVRQLWRSRTVAARLAAVEDGGATLRWEEPLAPELATAPALTVGGGARTSAATFVNIAGAPAVTVWARSPGAWGDGLTVRLGTADGAATASDPRRVQPPDRAASAVLDVSGFAPGDLVRVGQGTGVAVPVWAVVAEVDPARRLLHWVATVPARAGAWDASLPATLDLARPLSFTRVDTILSVEEVGRLQAALRRLSLVAGSARYLPRVLDDTLGVSVRAEVLPAVTGGAAGLGGAGALALLGETQALVGGGDGLAALTAADLVAGIEVLTQVGEVAITAVPDAHLRPGPEPAFLPSPPSPDPCLPPPGGPAPVSAAARDRMARPQERPTALTEQDIALVQQALVDAAERAHDRIALLEAPLPAGPSAPPEGALAVVRAWRRRFDTSYAALHYPWLRVLDPLVPGTLRTVPASGWIAGLCAQLDAAVGVWRAPANVALDWVHSLAAPVDEPTAALLHAEGIDAVRALPGRGIRPMGARTLSSDPALVHLSVRRFLLALEETLATSLQWAVFEPADWALRQLLLAGIGELLEAYWGAGALAGATAEEAYRVRCDDANNPPEEVAAGRLVVDVAVAPAVPSEFVWVRVGRQRDALELSELPSTAAVTEGGG
jgi:phage tail sheath protein FI